MTSRDFCYWLQGYFELNDPEGGLTLTLGKDQVATIRNHLSMVFKHEIDPSFGDDKKQSVLNAIHSGKPPSGEHFRC